MRSARRWVALAWVAAAATGFSVCGPGEARGCWRCSALAASASSQERPTAPWVEDIPDKSSVKVTVPVAGTLTRSAFKSAAAAVAASREIPGWRKKDAKKIPAGVVAAAVGAETIKAKAIEALSETEIHGAISSLGIEAVGQARLLSSPEELVAAYEPGEPFELSVAIDVWPRTEWTGSYEGLEISVERVAADADVRTKAMEALRERYMDLADAGRPAELGDSVVVDMEGFARAEDGGKAGPLPIEGAVGGEDLELVLEVGKFLPGLAEGLVGAEPGETRALPVDFPDAARFREKQPLAGCKALFEVTVKAVRTRTLPPLDDAFADRIRPGLTLADLEKEVEYTVGAQEDDKTKERVHAAIEDALIHHSTAPLPETVVVESARQKFAVMLADLRSRGTPDAQVKQMISPEGFDKYLKVVRPQVERDLRARLVVEAIARADAVVADPADVDDQLELVKRQYLQQEEQQDPHGASFNEERAREKIVAELVRLKVLDNVAAKAHITYTDPTPSPP